jgi:AraC-like DNA-binding protein
MELDIFQIFTLLIVFVSLLLAAFLLTARSENYLSNVLLALFLIVSAIDSDSIFLRVYIYPNYPAIGLFLNSFVFFKLPLLYLYLLSVTFSDFKLKWKHLWQGVPFIIDILIFIPRFYSQDIAGQLEYFKLDDSSPHRLIEVQISYILIHAQIAVYLVLNFLLVNKYRRLLLENYSNASLFNYKWLFHFLIIFSALTIMATLKNVFMFFGSEEAYSYSLFITTFVGLGYIIWLVFKTLQHPELFRGIDSKLQLVKSMVREDAEFENRDNIHDDLNKEVNVKVNTLTTFMAEQEPFLDPSLSVYELSKQLNLTTKDLSLLINHDLNQHFFDFVNGFRIRKAMEILKDPAKKDLTILEILYDVGFNSKSSFNTAFKKYTQTTPTEYRKKHLRSAA